MTQETGRVLWPIISQTQISYSGFCDQFKMKGFRSHKWINIIKGAKVEGKFKMGIPDPILYYQDKSFRCKNTCHIHISHRSW